MLRDTLLIEVDFNDVDEAGRLMATLRYASSLRKPGLGEQVYLRDDEGNRCWGAVEEVDDLIVYLALDRASWTTNVITDLLPERPQRSGGPAETEGTEVDIPELVH